MQCAGVGMDAVSEAAMVEVCLRPGLVFLSRYFFSFYAGKEIRCQQSLEVSGVEVVRGARGGAIGYIAEV